MKYSPQQQAIAEKELTKFGCAFNRDKDKKNAITVITFPDKTLDEDVDKLSPMIRRFPYLIAVDLGGTRVGNSGIHEVSKLGELQALYFDRTQVGDAILGKIAEMKKLQWLDLSNTQVTSDGIKELGKLESIQTLLLVNCAKIADEGLKGFENSARCAPLHLTNTPVTLAGIKAMGTLQSLVTLDLSGTKTNDAGLKETCPCVICRISIWQARCDLCRHESGTESRSRPEPLRTQTNDAGSRRLASSSNSKT
jgi:hypothetical protein